jgi:hypothetical protein
MKEFGIIRKPGNDRMRPMVEKTRHFFINPESIGFFKAILESYEDVGIFSVLDGKKGLIELIYPSSFEDDIRGIIGDMIHYGIEFREASDVR